MKLVRIFLGMMCLGALACRPSEEPKIGRLPEGHLRLVIRQHFGLFRICYEAGLEGDPTLDGIVRTRFVIGTDGTVISAEDAGSEITDKDVPPCVRKVFEGMRFDEPTGGILTVTYPIHFSPG